MSKPFDATTKHLIEFHPADWLDYLGLPGVEEEIEVIEADLSTVTAAADRVLRVSGETPYVAHIEMQAGYDETLDDRTLFYYVLLKRRHNMAVVSAVILLRPEADSPKMTGTVVYQGPDGSEDLAFRYRLVRVWQEPVERFLQGGLATRPLAPLARVTRAQVPAVVERMKERIAAEASASEAASLWTAAYVLMGMRYPANFIALLLRGVRDMKESVTYQAILAEGEAKGRVEGEAKGRVEEARNILLRQGRRRFGPPDAQVRAALEAIMEVERMEFLAEKLLEVESWEELLA